MTEIKLTVRHEDIQKPVGDAGKLLRKNRCGKIGKNGSGEKHQQSIPQSPDDFCSYGERREAKT